MEWKKAERPARDRQDPKGIREIQERQGQQGQQIPRPEIPVGPQGQRGGQGQIHRQQNAALPGVQQGAAQVEPQQAVLTSVAPDAQLAAAVTKINEIVGILNARGVSKAK